MRIEINPGSLLNLENICEVLYKLHPSVLDYLVDMERSLGDVLGFIDLDNLSLKEREFLSNLKQEEDYSSESITQDLEGFKVINPNTEEDYSSEPITQKINLKGSKVNNTEDSTSHLSNYIKELEEEKNSLEFYRLKKYLQLDTDEYIPIKIYVEVEDPVIGRKVKELVNALEKTRAPEQFYLNKKELDEDAYFAEGYDLTMNDEQKKKFEDFFNSEDVENLKELLKKENLYP